MQTLILTLTSLLYSLPTLITASPIPNTHAKRQKLTTPTGTNLDLDLADVVSALAPVVSALDLGDFQLIPGDLFEGDSDSGGEVRSVFI